MYRYEREEGDVDFDYSWKLISVALEFVISEEVDNDNNEAVIDEYFN